MGKKYTRDFNFVVRMLPFSQCVGAADAEREKGEKLQWALLVGRFLRN